MQCANPKVFRVKTDYLSRSYTVFIPCGKCYACECASRAEWALRMKYEFRDKRNVSAYFLTLTYDDDHLPVVGYNTKLLLDYYKLRPKSERNYWFSVLDKYHASLFIESLKHWYRTHYVTPLYYVNKYTSEFSDVPKRGFQSVYDDNTIPRYYLTGEYGDISNRCHMHLIVFFPSEVRATDLKQFSNYLWPFGEMWIESHISPAAQNYVAKHQVKDCCGTSFQNMVSPIFSLSSRYQGGIGRTLKDDVSMERKFLESLFTGDKSDLYYENPQGQVVYKIAVPRFLKKFWHLDRLDDKEFSVLERESLKNAKNYIERCMLDQNLPYLRQQYVELIADVNNKDNDAKLGRIVYELSRKYVHHDHERKLLYKRRKRNQKIQLLCNANIDYSHI